MTKLGVRRTRLTEPRRPWLLVVLSFVWTACSGTAATGTGQHVEDDRRDGGTPQHRTDAETNVEAMCGDTPVRLVDYVPDVPDVGRSGIGIQVPNVGVNETGLFYLLNWNLPLEAPEGPGGYVMHLPKGASEPVRLAVVSGGGSPGGQGLAVTRSAAIYSEAPEGEGRVGAIKSASPAGEEPVTLARTSGLAYTLVADEQHVYFVDDEGTKSVPLAGGAVRTLTSQKAYSIHVAGPTLYLAALGEAGSLSSVPIEGGQPTVLAAENAVHPVLCEQSVCWMTGSAHNMSLKQLSTNGTSRVLASGLAQPNDLLFTGGYFFTTVSHLALSRIPAGGGTPVVIGGGGLISSLAVDDDCLYWSEASGIYAWTREAAITAPPEFGP